MSKLDEMIETIERLFESGADEDHDTERALDKARMERVIQLKSRDIEERKVREKEDKKMSERLSALDELEKEFESKESAKAKSEEK